jgi:pSer/pThr/pTyr-binding forkhead associated (FHA) protein
MADEKGPPSTRAIETGQELPAPSADLYGPSDPLPEDQTAFLHIEAGPRAPRTLTIEKSLVVLGRGDRIADIDVGDESASRRHAFIAHRGGEFVLKDMGSTNGTVLNGEVISDRVLMSGDEIQIGTAVLRFELKPR